MAQEAVLHPLLYGSCDLPSVNEAKARGDRQRSDEQPKADEEQDGQPKEV